MRLDNVYVGYLKGEEREHIFYRRYITLEDISFSEFIDLESGERYKTTEVEDLKPFKEALNVPEKKQHSTRRKVVESYKTDREQMLNIRRIFYANMYNHDYIVNEKGRTTEIEGILKRNMLLMYDNGNAGWFIDLERNKTEFRRYGSMNIAGDTPIKTDAFEDGLDFQPKKRILELHRKKEL